MNIFGLEELSPRGQYEGYYYGNTGNVMITFLIIHTRDIIGRSV